MSKFFTPLVLLLLCLAGFSHVSSARVLVSQQELNQGLQLLHQQKNRQALLYFQKLAKKIPDDPVIKNNLAIAYARLGKVDQAIKLLIDALNTNPVSRMNYQNLKKLYNYQASLAYKEILSGKSTSAQLPKLALITQGKQPEQTKAEKPAVKQTQTKTDLQKVKQEVLAALQHWRQSWEKQNSEEYINSYTRNFKTTAFKNHQQWRSIRIKRINKPDFIQLTLSNLKFLSLDNKVVKVRFRQHYRSDSYQDEVDKLLVFYNTASGWKIGVEKNI